MNRARLLPVRMAAAMFVAASLTGCSRESPPPDVQAQIELLRSESLDDRYQALGNLQTLAAAGEEAVPELRLAMRAAKDDDLAAEIAKTLGAMGPAAAAAVPELTALLDRRAMWPRYAAVEALGRLGPAAAPALPKLVALTKDPNGDVAAAAVESVRRLRRATKKR